MTTLNRLGTTENIQSSDKMLIWSDGNGDSRKTSLQLLTSYLQDALTFPSAADFTTQRAAPSATGFSVAITDGSDDIHLILTPVAGYATGTITLPAVANAVDKQEVLVNSTQAVTTLTINGNGAGAVTGEPSTLAANDFFKLKYDLGTLTWYRVG